MPSVVIVMTVLGALACQPRETASCQSDIVSSTVVTTFCGHRQDRVIDSRESKEGDVIRRRRECLKCERRFTTYERSDEVPYMVVKRDGRREKFDRQKVLEGLIKACEKRPVAMGKLAEVVDEVDSMLADSQDREVSTTAIGELVMDRLPPTADLSLGLQYSPSPKLSVRLAAYNALFAHTYQPDVFFDYEPHLEYLPNPYEGFRAYLTMTYQY